MSEAQDNIITDMLILKQKSKPTSLQEVRDLKLKERLQAMMSKGWTEPLGWAAIQIGIPLAYGYYKLPDGKEVELINPVIIKANFNQPTKGEGCMSIPNKRFMTYRFNRIEYFNHIPKEDDGQKIITVDGLEARVVQHECDHMDGVLCADLRPPVQVGRNEPCACGSGRKFKKCCG